MSVMTQVRRLRTADRQRRGELAEAVAGIDHWFPGRWLGGASLVLGPLALLTGTLLRLPFGFFYPDQLQGYAVRPALITAAYATFALGNLLLWPGVLMVTRMIATRCPAWAAWAGFLVVFGLLTRAYHAGTDMLVFQVADVHGTQAAAETIEGYYRTWRDLTWHPFRILGGAVVLGWTVMAVGAYRSGLVGPFRAICLAAMSMLAIGTLKGTVVPESLIATTCLCIALVPLGVTTIRQCGRPSNRALTWTAMIAAGLILGMFFGPRG